MSRIFINYRRQDTEGYVGRLYDHLAQHFQRDDLFMDVDSIQPGMDFVQVLEDAVAACDVFIAVIGPQWATLVDESGSRRLDQWNDFVRIEIASALKQNKFVIPVLVGQARLPSPQELPEDIAALARRNALEVSHQRFTHDIERLVNAIKNILPNSKPPQSSVRSGAVERKQHMNDLVQEMIVKPAITSEAVQRKVAALKAVRDDLVNATTSPLYQFRQDNRAFPVIGDGNPDAKIMFIGEAPGKNEAERGVPFIGPSGEVLAELLAGIGLQREDVYVTNILMDRPPEKRDPTPEEIAYYTPFVDRLIDIVQPKVIAPLGRFAMDYMLKKLNLPEKGGKISQLHGKLIKTQLSYGEIHVVPLYHPAVVLYTLSEKDTLRKDFDKLKLFV